MRYPSANEMNPIAAAIAPMRREKIPRLVVRVVMAASLDVSSSEGVRRDGFHADLPRLLPPTLGRKYCSA
jgi:hypothetical protein